MKFIDPKKPPRPLIEEDEDLRSLTGEPDGEGADATEDPSSGGRRGRTPRTARTVALRLLCYRDYSSRQLREKLLEKGFDPAEISLVLEFLREKRMLDDIRYGEKLIAYLAERRYFGAYKIRMELFLKLDRESAEALLPRLEDYDFPALAADLIRKPPFHGKSREALIRKLKANGYSAADIRYAMNALFGDRGQRLRPCTPVRPLLKKGSDTPENF